MGASVCSPLRGNYNFIGLPFLVYDSPSLLSYQNGLPGAFQFDYFSESKHGELRGSFVKPFKNSGLSLGYEREGLRGYHRISGGLAHRIERLSFGSALHVMFKEEADFSVDFASSLNILENWFLSLFFRNVIAPDTVYGDSYREAFFIVGGPISEGQRISLSTGPFFRLVDFQRREFGFGFKFDLQKDFFRNPALNVYVGVYGESMPDGSRSAVAQGGAGWHIDVERTSIGVFGGYRYDYYGTMSGPYCSVYFNPVGSEDTRPPRVELGLSSVAFSPTSSAGVGRIVLSIRCVDEKHGVGVKRWMVVICENLGEDAEIVRTFAGGGTPPSNIVWDGRDSRGDMCKPRSYFIRLIGIDNNDNIAKTEWKEVVIQ